MTRRSLLSGRTGAIALAAGLLVALPGCRVKNGSGNVVNGKALFVSKCGSCHTLARANTKGTVGPNLDDAFRQSVRDGMKRSTIRGVVDAQILYPARGGVMPAGLVTGNQAWDVASYVADAAAKPGQDTGALASIGQGAKQTVAKEQGGKLTIPADPSGQLRYLASSATASAGQVTINSPNKSSVPHDISIEGQGLNLHGKVVSNGGVSSLSVTLKPGTYTFYCSVDGHRAAGMVGKITVK